MKRSSITLQDVLATALDVYIHDQDAPPTLTTVVQVALTQYLERRGYLPAHKPGLRISPAPRGSGRRADQPFVPPPEDDFASLPFFGMWADRQEMQDSEAYVRREREQWQQRLKRPG